ncbi:MAG: PqqD family protein [Acidobacteriota bacterium]
MKPIARRNDLVIKEVTGELFIQDLKYEKAVCLNPTSAYVWQKCDGKKDTHEIATEMRRELGLPVSENLVLFSLNFLSAEHLLENYSSFA